MALKKNINHADRIIRILAGAAILSLGIIYNSWLGLLGFLPIILAFAGWCPIYTLLGVDRCPLPPSPDDSEKR
ncbi:MAG: DUF2892 domain-containing protein [Elusimicrobiales bacterium]|nr:DUF2892 domain-containing protein [Elusimicrobiales bacterium]